MIKHVTYDAFGNLTSDSAPAVESLFLFTARPYDADTQLQNNLNRWYDPATGRWISTDPIGFVGNSASLYEYVSNCPAYRVDPLGLEELPRADGNGNDIPTADGQLRASALALRHFTRHTLRGSVRQRVLSTLHRDRTERSWCGLANSSRRCGREG